MRKILYVLFAVSLGFAACQNKESVVSEVSDAGLYAQIEQDEETRTVLGESNNILWSENDQILAFMKTSDGHQYQIKPSFVGKTYAEFSKISGPDGDDLSAGIEWDHIIAYYPYEEGIDCVRSDESYDLEVVLPSEQTYVANSFSNGLWPMVAVSEDNDLTFKNVCGGIKLQLKGTQRVTSIILRGKDGERLSGPATVTAYVNEEKPLITMTGYNDDVESVTLNCGDEGVQLNDSTATEFIIALPPVNFIYGFLVTVFDTYGNEYVIESNNENIVKRSSLLVMPPVKIDDSAEQENVRFSIEILPDVPTKGNSYAEYVDVVYYEVWDSDWSRKLYPNDESGLARETVVDGRATVDLSLASSMTYNIIFWAQNEECGAYDVTDLRRVEVDYSAMPASEDYEKSDAFYAVKCFTVDGYIEEAVRLKRPLAQLYVGEGNSDYASPLLKDVSITISNLPTVFNTIDGCGEMDTETQVTFVADRNALVADSLNGKTYAMNYVFASESESVDFEICFEIDGREAPLSFPYDDLPLKTKCRTTVLFYWTEWEILCAPTIDSIDDVLVDVVVTK